MSDDKLFRWNFAIQLQCEKCGGTVLVEEVKTEEIFCSTCAHGSGHVLAASRTEWPEDWDAAASYGKSTSEQSWIEIVPKPPPSELLFAFQGDSLMPPDTVIPTSSDPSAQFPRSDVVIPSYTQHDHVPSPSSSPSPSCETLQTQPLRPQVNSIDDAVPFDPASPHPYDAELIEQAQNLSLPYPAAEAAKRIVVKVESEKMTQKLTKLTASLFIRAALFLACRQIGHPKTFSEFDSDLDRTAKTQFHRQFKTLDSFIKQCPTPITPTAEDPVTPFPSFSVADFIRSEAATLSVDNRVRDRALAVAQHRVVQDLFAGRRPSMTAAVILSFAAECEECFWGTDPYAEVAKTSVQTVSNAQKTLLKAVEEMATEGPLPEAFRSRWNYPGYQPPVDGNYL